MNHRPDNAGLGEERAWNGVSCVRGRVVFVMILSLGLFSLSGAGCPKTWQQYNNPLPRALPESATLEQVIEVVNRNSSQIRSFSTNRASISGSGFPAVTASIAFERPKRFRLKAGAIAGTEVDLGSNDELFWFWVRRNQPPAMYFCRHDQLATSQAKLAVPFDPTWLIEMLGVAEFDPSLPHRGPIAQPNGRLRIDTVRDTAEGPYKKVTIVDASLGIVLEQYLFDPHQQLLASSVTSGHRRDPLSGLIMPMTAVINFPPGQLTMRVDLGNVAINQLSGDPSQLWAMPSYPNSPMVDMADPNFHLPGAPGAVAGATAGGQWQRPGR